MSAGYRKASLLLTTETASLLRIDRCLRSGAADFRSLQAAAGHVSAATLKRRLKAMREELGAPISYCLTSGRYRFESEWAGVAACVQEQLGAMS